MSPRRPGLPPLDREALSDDPIEQFGEWFELARRDVPLAEAISLATADADCNPNARMVLLKGFSREGFSFFTNYESAKGEELTTNPRAALVVYWRELDRQVRVRGTVERLPGDESSAYFATRPRDSQIAAAASPQSWPIERKDLDDRYERLARELGEGPVPRPDHWGGYLVRPDTIEFWQGRESRMHDRFRYTREGGRWRIERLAP
ncbi:MAG TPA: pyridoxamine 5'-phosphate oxidase [Solirubrobacterales bacterium]|nr:pyridoxamine 5'-phosphate oxidase [Solirubrobacterales bacterium]